MGVLYFIEFFAQLLNPRNNREGRFPGMGTHFAWLLTFEGHPPLILERLRDGDQFTSVHEDLHGLRVGKNLRLLGATVVKMDTIHHRVSLANVWQWLSNKKHQSYTFAFNNCKHFAYDPWNVWSFLLITFFSNAPKQNETLFLLSSSNTEDFQKTLTLGSILRKYSAFWCWYKTLQPLQTFQKPLKPSVEASDSD